MADGRHFTNIFGEYNEGNDEIVTNEGKLSQQLVVNIKEFLSEQMALMMDVIVKRRIEFEDESVYTGIIGISMLLWQLSSCEHVDVESKKKFLDTCYELLHAARRNSSKRRVTFLCGASGPLAVSAAVVKDKSARYIQELKGIYKQLSDDKLPNEVLYGRSGYLFSLLFVKKHCQSDPEIDTLIKEVAQMLIAHGKHDAHKRRSPLPLYYEWHHKEYIGAAHGYIGILYMLLQAKSFVPASVTDSDDAIITKCLDGLLDLRYPSGNMKSSIGSETDKLIHWCHGAPGAVHLYALAYKIYRDNRYIEAARLFADVIWNRGLLKKGYGICHGVAGNAYGLLCMYQLTKETSYLWKTAKFAEWCLNYGKHGCRLADRPYSLFEGLAGTLYFLNDILSPNIATFPAFQLVRYD